MSCLYCSRCDWLIDSDEDPDCFVSVGTTDAMVACESCREAMEESGELDWETNTIREVKI